MITARAYKHGKRLLLEGTPILRIQKPRTARDRWFDSNLSYAPREDHCQGLATCLYAWSATTIGPYSLRRTSSDISTVDICELCWPLGGDSDRRFAFLRVAARHAITSSEPHIGSVKPHVTKRCWRHVPIAAAAADRAATHRRQTRHRARPRGRLSRPPGPRRPAAQTLPPIRPRRRHVGAVDGGVAFAHGPTAWTPRTVDSLCRCISDGPFGSHLKSDDYTDQGARVVRLENIGHLSFDAPSRLSFRWRSTKFWRKHTLDKGDLLWPLRSWTRKSGFVSSPQTSPSPR